MPAFLIKYKRSTGEVSCTEYDSLASATDERIRLDETNTDPDLEIVAIAADSEEVLHRSHSRYFARALANR